MALSTLNHKTLLDSLVEAKNGSFSTCFWCKLSKTEFVAACMVANCVDLCSSVQSAAYLKPGMKSGCHTICIECFDKGEHHKKSGKFGSQGARCIVCVQEKDNEERDRNLVGFPMKHRVHVDMIDKAINLFDQVEEGAKTIEAELREAERRAPGGATAFRAGEAAVRRQEREEAEAAKTAEEKAQQEAAEAEAKARVEAAEKEVEEQRRERAEAMELLQRKDDELAAAEERANHEAAQRAEAQAQLVTATNMPVAQVVALAPDGAAATTTTGGATTTTTTTTGRGAGGANGRGAGGGANGEPRALTAEEKAKLAKGKAKMSNKRRFEGGAFKDLAELLPDEDGLPIPKAGTKGYSSGIIDEAIKRVRDVLEEREDLKEDVKYHKKIEKKLISLLAEENPEKFNCAYFDAADIPVPKRLRTQEAAAVAAAAPPPAPPASPAPVASDEEDEEDEVDEEDEMDEVAAPGLAAF